MAAVSPVCSAYELILLYRGEVDANGDELTQGVRSTKLLVEICRVAQPLSVLALFGLVFPRWQLPEIPMPEQERVRRAFEEWQREART